MNVNIDCSFYFYQLPEMYADNLHVRSPHAPLLEISGTNNVGMDVLFWSLLCLTASP